MACRLQSPRSCAESHGMKNRSMSWNLDGHAKPIERDLSHSACDHDGKQVVTKKYQAQMQEDPTAHENTALIQ